MMTDADDDRALIARHVRGDRDAFAELVHRHQDRLWRTALRTLGDADDAADAVQDALVSAYRSAASYRGEAAVTTWLHRIVVNACLDLARRRAARATSPLPDRIELADPAAGARFDQTDTAATILAALRRLPTEQAAAVVLVDVEGFSVRDAAQVLDVPEGTVKSRCARARARLAELLGGLAGNPSESAPVQRHEPPHSFEGHPLEGEGRP